MGAKYSRNSNVDWYEMRYDNWDPILVKCTEKSIIIKDMKKAKQLSVLYINYENIQNIQVNPLIELICIRTKHQGKIKIQGYDFKAVVNKAKTQMLLNQMRKRDGIIA